VTELLLGIDVGTYSSKGVLCRRDGTVVASCQVNHGLSVPKPGYAEHDADAVWWADVCQISRELAGHVAGGERIGVAAISAIGPSLVALDDRGRPLRPAILYGVDTRATQQIGALEERYGRDALVALGGMRLTSQAVGPKIMWLRENEPDVHAAAASFVTATTYLNYRLTGELVIDRHTASHFNPLIDIATLEWDDRFADSIARSDQLATPRWSNELIGSVSPGAAAETGIPAGTPVTAGAVDALAEAVSVGVVSPGDLMLMYGSTAFMILVTDRATGHPDLWTTAGALPGQYALAAGLATSGAATTWFRDQFAGELVAAHAAGGPDPYEVLAAEAALSPPGARGVLALPYLSGERTPLHDPDARGVFAGLSLAHTRGDLYRALLEGVACAIAHNIDTMQSAAGIDRLVAVGGGAVNRLWLQIVSDVSGRRQLLPRQTIGAAYGDAFLGGLAIGAVDRDALPRDWVDVVDEIEPDERNRERYHEQRALFHKLYAETKDTVHALSASDTPGGPKADQVVVA
jgi:xylulokinase